MFCLMIAVFTANASGKDNSTSGKTIPLDENRFLTFNTVIRVNQIEVSRDENVGVDERDVHTPEKVIKFRDTFESG